MISDARGRHTSPGIYTEERDVTYSVKSLGLTSLGLVGETLKGPAFQNIEIEDWSTYVDYFGGTSTEKYKANGRPRYELPYIAKSYLEKSKRLNVVRVLGLSGYNAGPAWVLYQGEKPILTLRSKMTYDPVGTEYLCESKPETVIPVVDNIEKTEYKATYYTSLCEKDPSAGESESSLTKIGIKVTCKKGSSFYGRTYQYNVSLDSSDKDYIYNVIGTDPASGEAPIYIDSLYEGMLDTNSESVKPLSDFTKMESIKTDEDVKTYYKVAKSESGDTYELKAVKDGESFDENAAVEYTGSELTGISKDKLPTNAIEKGVYISSKKKIDDYYSSYFEAFRCAQTPWIVSNVSANDNGGNKTATMKKLFKFYTISDGNSANYQVKISIQNIRPSDGTFDVVVRDFYDTDAAPIILERFSKCNMVEGDSGFIGYKIGTYDGGYTAKSKYITVELADNDGLESCVPAGFLGYPSLYGNTVELKYNDTYNTGIKAKRQYFGLNNNVLDTDILDYKGRYAYSDGDFAPKKLTNGFHLDSILNVDGYGSKNTFVDGVSGYTFTTVSTKKVNAAGSLIPRIIDGAYMSQTIYEDVNVRKFTLYPYGGFDGWDVNRGYRTNTDEFKANKYNIESSVLFKSVSETGYRDMLKLGTEDITTDYYAFLGGYKQFANPEDVDINVFATPGIDWYNNTLLTEDALDVIEDKDDGRGGDALYVMDSPQYDENGNQYSADEVSGMLENIELDSSYACTYFPWVKYFDNTQKRYLDLPVTKDVVRNIADTDNNAYPWYAPAGVSRGPVDCIAAVKKTTLDEEDTLYNNRINPVKSFAQDGVKIWGNKTLYSSETSPLNRINVRRLMIRLKKLITNAAKALIFEQYDSTLEKQFRSLVEPILADAKSNRGITDYKVITEVTAETMDQHILPAKVMVKPVPSLEWVSISFVVYPQSVEFDENL